MNKQQQILKRIIILMCQMAESIENGDIKMGYIRDSTDEIEKMIDSLTLKNETNQ